jgi:hypothetical protein
VQSSTAACAAAAQLSMRLQSKQGAHEEEFLLLWCMQQLQLREVRTIIMLDPD